MLDVLLLVGKHRRLFMGLFGLGVLLYIVLLCASAATRKPWNDEAEAAAAGYNLAYKGFDGVQFFDEKTYGLPGVNKHSYYIFPFQICVLAAWFRIVPFSLLSLRVLAMLWAGVMFVAIYYAARKLLDDGVIAFVATVLTALNYQVMTAASFGRYDTMIAALGFGSYAVYLNLRETNLRWAIVIANILVCASGTTHPNGIFYFTGLWFLIFYYDRSRIGWKDVASAAVPYVIAGTLWAAYIMQDLASFRGQISRNTAGRLGLINPLEMLRLEFERRIILVYGLGAHSVGHDSPIVRLKVIGLLAILFGILGCALIPAIRRNRAYRAFFWLLGIHWFLLTFSETMKFAYYLIHALPLFCCAIAIVLTYLWREHKAPRWALAAGTAALVLVEVGGIGAKIKLDDFHRSYLPAVKYVAAHASPNDLIHTSCSFGFAYGFDKNILDDSSLGYTTGQRPAYFVNEEVFDIQQNLVKASNPEVYEHIKKMVDTYKLVYQNSEYRVYQRPDLAASAAVKN